jgi:DGQHR domain-containing protein
MNTPLGPLKRRALQLCQVPDAPLYLFTLAAGEVFSIADISRLSRDQEGALIGYQRQEAKPHIQEIADYLNGEHPLFPHALILALSSDVRFTSQRGPGASDGLATSGTLLIPRPATGQSRRPAWIVDGQQRALALAQAKNPLLPIPIAGFVADSVTLQRDQFIRVNSARLLDRGLVDELLPQLDSPLPTRLAARQLPSRLVDALNTDPSSPFFGIIRRESLKAAGDRRAVVSDKSVSDTIKESLHTGCLSIYKDLDNRFDNGAVWTVLVTYWTAVKDAFPEAWGRPPTQSRLMHGAGIRAMGRLMDRMLGSLRAADLQDPQVIRGPLNALAAHCHWTSGRWDALDRDWNHIQNTPQDINLLSRYLERLYVFGEQ